jgi:hypothetical protein
MVRHNTDGEGVGRKFALGQVGAPQRSDLGKFDMSSAEFPFYPQAHPSCGSGHLGLLRVQVHHIENR